MSNRRIRWALPLASATVALFAAAAPAGAAILPGPTPVGPGQWFVPFVNGQSSVASILVDCPSGVSGHPARGQTIAVQQANPATTQATGFTGDAAAAIDIGPGDPRDTPVQLRLYDQVVALPTTLIVPCSGSGLFTFVPDPTSPTAVPASVKVTYVNAA
jgi:hypothetical protein